MSGQKAYMTVEASFVIPFVLFLFAGLIRLAFFQYDRCAYDQDAYIACFRESLRKEDGAGAAELGKRAQEQFGGKYLMAGTPSMTATEQGRWLILDGRGSAAGWGTLFSARAKRIDPPAGIRRYRRLGYIANRIMDAAEEAMK
ncbi:MAG: hypothetical protein J6I56_09680 [Lachnospiraceae bacterium]|nr:hypothetical protein [Lachnospiraceae bacterium]